MPLAGRIAAHTVAAFKLQRSPHYLMRPSISPDNCILPRRPWEEDKLPLSRGTLQYSAVRPRAGGRAPRALGFGGGMTGRTQQCFYAIYFHEQRAGGIHSSKENPAEVPLAAKDRLGAPLSKGPSGRRGRRSLRFLVAGREERPGNLRPLHSSTERSKYHLHVHTQHEINTT